MQTVGIYFIIYNRLKYMEIANSNINISDFLQIYHSLNYIYILKIIRF